MFNTLRRKATLWATMAAILFAAATPAFSQAPTDAQRSAIRSECRSDYEAHCASIPPGGKASLQCLQQNMSSLSSGCQAAVRAVEAPAAPKAESTPAAPKVESAPAAATAKPAAETAPPAAGLQGGSRHSGSKARRCEAHRDPKRVPHRLSEELRRRADRRCRGVELFGKEQGEPFGELPESRRRGWQRRHNACGRRAGGCNNRRSWSRARRDAGASDSFGAAADAAPRSGFRLKVSLRRGCSRALRGRSSRWRSYYRMFGCACRLTFTGMRRCSEPVRGAIK